MPDSNIVNNLINNVLFSLSRGFQAQASAPLRSRNRAGIAAALGAPFALEEMNRQRELENQALKAQQDRLDIAMRAEERAVKAAKLSREAHEFNLQSAARNAALSDAERQQLNAQVSTVNPTVRTSPDMPDFLRAMAGDSGSVAPPVGPPRQIPIPGITLSDGRTMVPESTATIDPSRDRRQFFEQIQQAEALKRAELGVAQDFQAPPEPQIFNTGDGLARYDPQTGTAELILPRKERIELNDFQFLNTPGGVARVNPTTGEVAFVESPLESGKDRAAAMEALENQKKAFEVNESILDQLQKIAFHPGRSMATGKSFRFLPGMFQTQNMVSFAKEVNRLKAILTLGNRELLRGAGPLTDADMILLENAATSLSQEQGDEAFLEEIKRLQDVALKFRDAVIVSPGDTWVDADGNRWRELPDGNVMRIP